MTNFEKLQDAYKAFMEGNLDPVFNLMSDDIVWKNHSIPESPLPTVSRGKEAVMNFFKTLSEKTDMQRFEVEKHVGDEDAFLTIIKIKNVFKDSGITIEGQRVDIARFLDGKMVSFDGYDPLAN